MRSAESKLERPLSKSEMMCLFSSVKSGDEEAIEQLMRHNRRLVIFTINKFFSSKINTNAMLSLDDFESEGLKGLYSAIKKYDPSQGKFSAYAVASIRNSIGMYIRYIYNRKRNTYENKSLNEVFSNDVNGKYTLSDLLLSPINIEEEILIKEKNNFLYSAINTLSHREKTIVILKSGFYDKKLNDREISELFNCSKQNINMIYQSALKKLKLYLKEQGISSQRKNEDEIKEFLSLSKEEKSEFIYNLYVNEGLSVLSLSRRFNVTEKEIQRYLIIYQSLHFKEEHETSDENKVILKLQTNKNVN